MAISILNLKAQDKGAMTLKPFANSTFIKSLLLLEDTMKTLKLLTANASRREARKTMRQLYPEIDWKMHYVHHIDNNPFNNHFSNLKIVYRQDHRYLHCVIKKSTKIEKLGFKDDDPCPYCGRKIKNNLCLCGRLGDYPLARMDSVV